MNIFTLGLLSEKRLKVMQKWAITLNNIIIMAELSVGKIILSHRYF